MQQAQTVERDDAVYQQISKTNKQIHRLYKLLGRTPMGFMTIGQAALKLGIPLKELEGILTTNKTDRRVLYHSKEGRIWRT